MPQHVPPRIYRRVPFETAVRLKFDRFHGFVEQYSANLSLGGMFIHTAEPPPAGTEVAVEFALEDGFELIRGRGRVTWVCEAGEGETAGFGLRFLELTPGSRELIFRLVERRVREGDRVFDLEEEAPSTVAGRLVHDAEERLATPPWDRPAPRGGEATTAAGGAAGPAPAPGDEVVRYGRAAREAAESAAAGDAVEAEEEAGAAGPRAAALDAAGPAAAVEDDPEATAVSTPRTDPAATPEPATAGVDPEATAVGVPGADPAAAPASATAAGDDATAAWAPAVATGWAASPAEAPETVGAAAPAGAPAVSGGWLVDEAAQDAPGEASAAASGAAAVVHDPTASFAGLVDEEEEEEDRAFGRAALPAETPWAATGGEPGAAAAGETSPSAAKWAWLEGEAATEPPAAAEPGAGEGLAAEPSGARTERGADEDLAAEPSGARPARARRGGRIAAALVAGVVAAAVGGFLLFQVLGADAPAGPVAEEPAARAVLGADGSAAPDAGPTAPPEGADSPAPDAAPAAPPPPAASDPPAADAPGPRSIERIAWERRGGGVDFEIAGSGPIPPARVDHFRVAGERPRLVVRIAGVERPYARGDVAVGGALVERVRTGFHPAAGGAPGSLHVVFDLAAADAAAAVDTVDGRVRVRFEER